MRKFKTLVFVILLISLTMTTSFSKERDLYIGDLVTIEVDTLNVNEADIKRAFVDFEIHQIEVLESGYLVTVSTLEVGEHQVELGGNTILFKVSSTLEPYENGDIYEGDLTMPDRRLEKLMPILMLISGSLLLVSLLVLSIRYMKKRPKKPASALELFKSMANSIDIHDKNSLGVLTKALKIYCSSLYSKPLIGYSSEDFIVALEEQMTTRPVDIVDWLNTCDRYKYQNMTVVSDQIISLRNKLLNIVETLDKSAK